MFASGKSLSQEKKTFCYLPEGQLTKNFDQRKRSRRKVSSFF
jgi:hypothetical protein